MDSIERPVAVVKDLGSQHNFFVVGNKTKWLDGFVTTAEALRPEETLSLRESMYEQQFPEPYNTTTDTFCDIIDDGLIDDDIEDMIFSDDE